MGDESEEIMSKEEQKKLFAEWTEDYAAHREIDLRERAAGLPPHPRPSEIAKDKRPFVAEQENEHGHDEGHSR